MALIKGPLIASGSGAVGGIVLFKSSGGLAIRARTVPLNPNTPQQSFIRTAMANLANRWANTLTQAQRDLWNVYAINTPLIGPLGDARTVSGINMYIRANVVRRQATSLPRQDVAPVIFDLGEFDPINAITASGPTSVGFAFDPLDTWANTDDSAMLVYTSRPQNESIEFFRGPYQLAGQVDGDAVTPPTSPASVTSPFLLATGQKVFIRVQVSTVDGRLSNQQFASAVVS